MAVRRLATRAPGLVAAVLIGCLVAAPGANAQGWGWGGGPDRKIVSQFDKNGDKRLDRAERAAARGITGNQARNELGRPGVKLSPAQVNAVPATKPLYDMATLRTLFLDFENADWEDELEEFNDSDVEVPATLTVDGKIYKEVGVHFRGASSFMRVPSGSKRSLNVDTEFVHKQQKLLGYNSLNLLNAMNDPSFLRTVLYGEISRAYAPTPKVNFVRTVINGENWGIYLNAQQFNRDFLRENFPGKDGGARFHIVGNPRGGDGGLTYLGANVAPYKSAYEIKTKDDPKSWARLIEFTRVLNETPPARLEAALAPLLDIDAALKFMAIEVALANSDGYWSRASDYNLYLDTDGRFHVVAHDFNEAMDGRLTLDPLVYVDDDRKPLRSKLLAVPALRERYLRYVRDIAQNWLDWNRVGPMVTRYQTLIGHEVASDTRKLYSTAAFRSSTQELRDWMAARRSFLLK